MPLPLRVPLELLEHILFLALGGDCPPASPFTCSELRSPASMTSLLLVSKGITAFALPLYWRSICISQSSDWARLWDPKRGLLAGEAGKRRAGWVEEIRIDIAPHGRIPIDRVRLRTAYQDGYNPSNFTFRQDPFAEEILPNLKAVPFPQLKHICFYAQAAEADALGDRSRDSPHEEGLTGEEAWELEAKTFWDAGSEDRWQAFLEEREYGQNRDEEADELDEDEWQQEDAIRFVEESAARESELLYARRHVLHHLLRLDNRTPPIVRAPADDAALDLLLKLEPGTNYRIEVYPVVDEHLYRTLKTVHLFKHLPYDFVGVPHELRPSLRAVFLGKQSHASVGQWCWVNEDGTKELLVNSGGVQEPA
jgi:hypothetical protein